MQDDYFLTRELDTKILYEVVGIMEKEGDIDCIYLNINANGIHKEAVYSNWKRVSRKDFICSVVYLGSRDLLIRKFPDKKRQPPLNSKAKNDSRACGCS